MLLRIKRSLSSYLAALAAFGALSAVIASAQSGPQVWVLPSLSRAGITDAPGSSLQATLWAARGEYEPFQVVVRPGGSGLTNLDLSVSDLVGPGNQVISAASYTLYREYYVHVPQSSQDMGGSNRPLGPGWYADGLIPFKDPVTGAKLTGALLQATPVSVPAGQNQPFWVDLAVPRSAAPGQYSGTLTVTSDQGSATVSVNLHVWNFTLPAQPSLKSSFGVYAPNTQDKPTHEELLRHKIMPFIVNPTDESDLMSRLGLNTTGLWFWTGANVGTCSIPAPPSVATIQSSMAQHQAGLPTYLYTADEIKNCPAMFPNLKLWAENIHSAGSRSLITVPPIQALQDDGSGTGRSAVDIWVLHPKYFSSYPNELATVKAKGDEVWSYNALVQDSYSPKWLVDFTPVNFRIQSGFISQSLGLKGLLYWAVNYWTSDPWNNIQYPAGGYQFPGEGILVYPGAQVGISGVAPSMRLKWLREGVEDYEYVEILKQMGWGNWALQAIQPVAADFANWSNDPSAIESVRMQLGQQIDALNTGGNIVPPAILSGSPSGTLLAGVTQATLSLATNENATCRYATVPGVAYASMPYSFVITGGTAHFTVVLGLLNGGAYRYYARCKDGAGNADTGDYTIAFGIAQPPAPAPSPSTTYEAESGLNTLTGTAAIASCGACSGRREVQLVGNYGSNPGAVQFNGVTVTTAGAHSVTIYYLNGSSGRTGVVTVNGAGSVVVAFPKTGNWSTVGKVQVNLSLKAGVNTIGLSNPSGPGPDLDRIVVQ
jgi:hypothetical protein